MRLFPRGNYLPVHCCCDPERRLGWVPAQKRLGPVRFVITPRSVTLAFDDDAVPVKHPAVTLDAEVEKLHARGETILAVKSNDHPIEQWRRVPGWIDDTSGA
jgi:hypothetical protein